VTIRQKARAFVAGNNFWTSPIRPQCYKTFLNKLECLFLASFLSLF